MPEQRCVLLHARRSCTARCRFAGKERKWGRMCPTPLANWKGHGMIWTAGTDRWLPRGTDQCERHLHLSHTPALQPLKHCY
jgi:hypothetical protein